MMLPHLAARLFGAPLLIARPKLDVILAVLGSRLGVEPPATLLEARRAQPVTPTPTQQSMATPGIAVIPIHGTLVRRTVGLEAESGLTSYAAITGQLEAALASPAATAILLDIDSPGGEAGGVFDLAERIRAAAKVKLVWAVANDLAFSAAYALASGASRIVVSRTGGVGSIGVIAMHVDQSIKDAQDGVRYTAVFAGERKNDLNPHAPISDSAHAFLQGEVNRVYDLFVATVAQHRGLSAEAVRATQAGLFFGPDAVTAGLADAVGNFDDALAQLGAALASPRSIAVAAGGDSSFHLLQETTMRTEPTTKPVARTDALPESESILASPPPIPLVVSAPDAPAPTSAPVAVPAPALTPAVDPVTPAIPMAISDAVDIAETCQLAGRSDLIAGFLEAAASPADVRRQLLAAQADASPEVTSRIDPNAPARAAMAAAENPLLQAVKQRLAAQSNSKS